MAIARRREASVEVAELGMPGGNALSYANMKELGEVLSQVEASDARALVLTGRGSVFSTPRGSGLILLGRVGALVRQ